MPNKRDPNKIRVQTWVSREDKKEKGYGQPIPISEATGWVMGLNKIHPGIRHWTEPASNAFE